MTPRDGRAVAIKATIIALVVVSACASRRKPAIAAQAGASAAIVQLRQDLDALFGDPVLEHVQWSVAVQSLQYGEPVYILNATKSLVPASNEKVLTSAVAAERLGWDHHYTTRIYATGSVSPEGTLDGDLVVTSDGDPTINPRHPARWAVFDEWAAAIASRGIRMVSGRLIGDDDAFDEPGWGLGWSWDDFVHGFGSPTGALQFNENEADFHVAPAREVGARLLVTLSPSGSGLTIDSTATTAAAGAQSLLTLERLPGSDVIHVRGQMAINADPEASTVSVYNPTVFYVNALRDALTRHGVTVAGGAVDVDDLPSRPSMDVATLLVDDQSPPLSEIIDVLMKWSRNGYAETILRSLAPAGGPTTAEAGLVSLRDTLAAWGIPPEQYLARDGSGLSRYDWTSADVLVRVLTHVWADPKLATPFRSALPVAGVSGGLADRMKGTPAQGRVWAKTGSMSQVRALSGYVETMDGETLAFSVLANGFRLPARDLDAVIDRALVRLVGLRRGP